MALSIGLQNAFDLSRDPLFLNRVTIALLDYVKTVATEDVGTADHANRLILAAQILIDARHWSFRMAPGIVVVSNEIQTAGTNATVTDAMIATAVTSVWNFYADAAVALQGANLII